MKNQPHTLFALDKPDDQLLDGVGKLWVRLQTLLEALVVVLEGAATDDRHGRQRVERDVVVRVEARLVVALLAT